MKAIQMSSLQKNFVVTAIAWACAFCLCLPTRGEELPSKDTDWLMEAKYGLFMHFLPDGDEEFKRVDQFDVEALAKQVEETGAKYFGITLGQNSGYYNSPNATYDKYTGHRPGERCSKRDLPMELYQALKPRGIRLILYLPCQTPNRDTNAQKAFGLPEQAERDQKITPEFAAKWAQVIQEWSDRYGDMVSGWWFDNGYGDIFNEAAGHVYAKAVRSGNPHAIMTFNGPRVSAENYMSGEFNEPFKFVPNSRAGPDGKQWHALTFMGSRWGVRDTRYRTEEWTQWVKRVTDHGGAVTIDVGPNCDPEAGPIGTISDEQMQQLKAIKAAVYGAPKNTEATKPDRN